MPFITRRYGLSGGSAPLARFSLPSCVLRFFGHRFFLRLVWVRVRGAVRRVCGLWPPVPSSVWRWRRGRRVAERSVRCAALTPSSNVLAPQSALTVTRTRPRPQHDHEREATDAGGWRVALKSNGMSIFVKRERSRYGRGLRTDSRRLSSHLDTGDWRSCMYNVVCVALFGQKPESVYNLAVWLDVSRSLQDTDTIKNPVRPPIRVHSPKPDGCKV